MVYTIGETVVDIIINSFDDVKIRPGGSMLNSAVSLGRMLVPVAHLSYIATDEMSTKLNVFLADNGVDTHWLKQCSDIKTNLALAFLDEHQKASYSFYKYFPANSDFLTFPTVCSDDVVLFGSFFSLNETVHPHLLKFVSEAKMAGALVVYDPNFRKPHLAKLEQLRPLILKNMEQSHIIKASDEDMLLIFGCSSGPTSWETVKRLGVKMLIYTKGNQGAELFTPNFTVEVPSQKVNVVSTVGAGDTFSAAIIFWLLQHNLGNRVEALSDTQASDLLQFAHFCSGVVCGLFDNYLPKGFEATGHV